MRVALVVLLALSSAGAQAPERIAVNDNRTAAGTLAGGVLSIRLEAREGESSRWRRRTRHRRARIW